MNFEQIIPSMPYILQGIWVTLQIVLIAGLLGFAIGILLSFFKIGRVPFLRWFADGYTSIFRGTPLVLQLMIIYYASPQLFGVQIDAYTAAILSFALNSAAYISEIIRAGIQAVDKGQREAAMALGVPYNKMMKDVILPQGMKNILPALMNEFITLTKESAIVTVIGVTDIMRRAYIVGSDKFSFLEPLLFAGLIYYLMVLVLTFAGKWVEGRMRRSD
ncbi:amino acid ABC transporter permease [Jeotgalibacillus salarius]|uniref:Amino acid ABC transporter permease n=1 Tax=Jeotgalibacillus salarius TaxID=546023 RepID=A0A4Y8LQE9_9BACL|nr:amino acid ABC transporter permease [Jeotgalibacillus salarius]TFE03167.1 amino acid ABC transporter permease [Jeotgalibacillus salarius]